MHVILAGGGIGGLAAALALASRGVEVTVLERSPVLAEAGAGLQLSPNATRILFALGLEAELRAIAFQPEAVEVREHGSRALLLRTELGAAAERRWGAPYLQVHRADLHSLLVRALKGRTAVEVRLGRQVLAFEQDGRGVSAQLAGGEALGGDALIGCDGIHSAVRALLWGERAARFTGQVAWRGLADVGRLGGLAGLETARVWTGAGRHFVHYPVRNGALVNVVGVVASRRWTEESWTAAADRDLMRRDFDGWPEPVQALTGAMGETWRFAIHDRAPLGAWARGRVSLLGDAAHPAPPFLAQGAAMAIEDGEALARRLTSGAPVPDALQLYEGERLPRTARVQAWSRRNAQLFHLPAVAARAVFGAAALAARTGAHGAARLDWLYGYEPH